MSVETEIWISLALFLKSLFFYEILQKASLNTKQSKPYAKSEVKQFIGEKFNLKMFTLCFLIQTER